MLLDIYTGQINSNHSLQLDCFITFCFYLDWQNFYLLCIYIYYMYLSIYLSPSLSLSLSLSLYIYIYMQYVCMYIKSMYSHIMPGFTLVYCRYCEKNQIIACKLLILRRLHKNHYWKARKSWILLKYSELHWGIS